jgi:hypothetical protein
MVIALVLPSLSRPALSTIVGTESMFHSACTVGAACAGLATTTAIIPAAAAVAIHLVTFGTADSVLDG